MPTTKKPVAKQQTNEDMFYEQFANLFPNVENEKTWLNQMFTVAQKILKKGYDKADIPDQLLNDTSDATAKYRERFSGIFELKRRRAAGEAVPYIPTVADYASMEKKMVGDLANLGLSNIANNKNIGRIIGAGVDYEEFNSRIQDAFKSIDSADQYLKEQINTAFPGATREDIASALLTGKEGATALKNKVETFGIKAAAAEFGVKSQLDAAELQKMGLTRSEARSGYQNVKAQEKGISIAAKRFGTDAENLQKELETSNVTGKTSNNVERLRSQARAEFQQQSGIAGYSLKRKKSANI